MDIMTHKPGDIVRPANDGEDPVTGKIFHHTKARLRVIAAWNDRVEVVVVRPGGAFNRGRLELRADDVVPAELAKPRKNGPRLVTVVRDTSGKLLKATSEPGRDLELVRYAFEKRGKLR